jgi:hypothetical protein
MRKFAHYPISRLHVVTNSLTNTGGLSPIRRAHPVVFYHVLAERVVPQSAPPGFAASSIAP